MSVEYWAQFILVIVAGTKHRTKSGKIYIMDFKAMALFSYMHLYIGRA